MEEQKQRVHKRRRLLLIVGIVASVLLTVAFVAAMIAFVWKIVDNYELDEKVQIFLEAIIEEDSDKLHTVSYSQTLDAGELAEALRQEGIELQGEVQVKLPLNVSIQPRNGGASAEGKYLVTVGSEKYYVTFSYQKDENGDGITGLWIDPS